MIDAKKAKENADKLNDTGNLLTLLELNKLIMDEAAKGKYVAHYYKHIDVGALKTLKENGYEVQFSFARNETICTISWA